MGSNLQQVRDLAKDICNRSKSTERWVNDYRFAEAWQEAKPAKREEVVGLITEGNYQEIRKWVKNESVSDLHELGIHRLQDLAKICGIPYYGRKKKAQLIEELEALNVGL